MKKEKAEKKIKKVEEKEVKKKTLKHEDFYKGVGRRKSSVARVWLKLEKGPITVNDKSLEDYFAPFKNFKVFEEPFRVVNRIGQMSGQIKVNGGGVSSQAGAVLHGISRALLQYDETYPGNEHMIDIHKISTFEQWNPMYGDLDFVSSTQGFVLHLAPQQQYIELYGDVQDPSVPVELHADFENWVGYFLPYAQHPVNAKEVAKIYSGAVTIHRRWSCAIRNQLSICTLGESWCPW